MECQKRGGQEASHLSLPWACWQGAGRAPEVAPAVGQRLCLTQQAVVWGKEPLTGNQTTLFSEPPSVCSS